MASSTKPTIIHAVVLRQEAGAVSAFFVTDIGGLELRIAPAALEALLSQAGQMAAKIIEKQVDAV